VLAETGSTGHSEHFAPVRLVDATPGAISRARVMGADADGLTVETI